jgi:enamine deaminase RidA (YjgF/YER057c/UK114 family)
MVQNHGSDIRFISLELPGGRMTAKRDWTPHAIGQFSLGRWAGDLLHMAGLVAMYPETGRPIRGYADLPDDVAERFRSGHISVDAREEGIVSQTWAIFDIGRQHLENEGLSLDHIVHMLVLFTDLRDFPGYHRVRHAMFPTDPPPATVMEVSELLPSNETLLEIQIVASRELPSNLLKNPS